MNLNDPRELLELHLQEQEEHRLRAAIIDCLVELVEYRQEEEQTGEDWSIERDYLRHELHLLRQAERKAQRINNTSLVLESATYDLQLGDDPAEVTNWDLDRLAYHGITVPTSACLVEELDEGE